MECRRCGSENLEFTEGVKGNYSFWFILLSVVITFALIIGSVYLITVSPIISVILFLCAVIYLIVFRIVRFQRRRKTCTKAICKDCGHIFWLE